MTARFSPNTGHVEEHTQMKDKGVWTAQYHDELKVRTIEDHAGLEDMIKLLTEPGRHA